MDNQQKLMAAFSAALDIAPDEVLDELAYQSIPQWDSVAHMALIAALEEMFGVMLDTDEILEISSVAKARQILVKHEVVF
jgi:acyl carrier protein